MRPFWNRKTALDCFKGFVDTVLRNDTGSPWCGLVVESVTGRTVCVTLGGGLRPSAGDDLYVTGRATEPSVGLGGFVEEGNSPPDTGLRHRDLTWRQAGAARSASRPNTADDPVLSWALGRFSEEDWARGDVVVTMADPVRNRLQGAVDRAAVMELVSGSPSAILPDETDLQLAPLWRSPTQTNQVSAAMQFCRPINLRSLKAGPRADNVILDPPAVPALHSIYAMSGPLFRVMLPREIPAPTLFRCHALAHEMGHSFAEAFGHRYHTHLQMMANEAFADAVAALTMAIDGGVACVQPFVDMRAMTMLLPRGEDTLAEDGLRYPVSACYCIAPVVARVLEQVSMLRDARATGLGTILPLCDAAVAEVDFETEYNAIRSFQSIVQLDDEVWAGRSSLMTAIEKAERMLSPADRLVLAGHLSALRSAISRAVLLAEEPDHAVSAERSDLRQSQVEAEALGLSTLLRSTMQRMDLPVSYMIPDGQRSQIMRLRSEALQQACERFTTGAGNVSPGCSEVVRFPSSTARGDMSVSWALEPADRMAALASMVEDFDMDALPNQVSTRMSSWATDIVSAACSLHFTPDGQQFLQGQTADTIQAVDFMCSLGVRLDFSQTEALIGTLKEQVAICRRLIQQAGAEAPTLMAA